MRSQIIVLALWLCGAFTWVVSAGQAPAAGRALGFPEGDHLRLGELSIGSREVRFSVRNRSRQPVQVSQVSGSCTCMQLDFEQGPMAPGEIRECVVELNVQAGNQKTTAVIFDIDTPSPQRVVKMITFTGIQQDVLDIRVDPPELSLTAGEVRRVSIDCRWVSQDPIEPDQTIAVVLERARGVELVAQEEVARQDTELSCRYTLDLDARSLGRISADLSFHAGQPVRASETGKLDFVVTPSLDIRPGSLLVDGAARAGEDLGEVDIDLAEGWRVETVEAPAWIEAELVGDRLRVALEDAPPFSRGIAEIEVNAASASGASVTRKLKCIVDGQEQ